MTTDATDELTELMLQRQVAYTFKPQASQRDDGNWQAHYPGADWTVTGNTRDDALAHLRAAALEQQGTDEETNWQLHAVKTHIANGPVAGVYEIPLSINNDIMNSPAPQAALNTFIQHLDDAAAAG